MGKFGVGGFKNKKSLTVLETASFWPMWSQNDVVYGLFFFSFFGLDQNDVVLNGGWVKRHRLSRCQNDAVLISAWSKRRRFDPGRKKKNLKRRRFSHSLDETASFWGCSYSL